MDQNYNKNYYKDYEKNYYKDYEKNAKRLTKEEERELFARIQNGDEKARDELIQSCAGIIVKLAEKYKYIDGSDINDLKQEGYLKLYACYDKFKPDDERGARFSTYAHLCVENKFKELLQKSVTDSKRLYPQIVKMNQVIKEYSVTYDEEPSEEKLAEIMGISRDALIKLRSATKQEVSYIRNIREDGREISTGDAIVFGEYSMQGASAEEKEAARNLDAVAISGWLDSLEDVLYSTGLGKKISAKFIIEVLYGLGEVEERKDIKDLAKKLYMSETDLKRIVSTILKAAEGDADIKQLGKDYLGI